MGFFDFLFGKKKEEEEIEEETFKPITEIPERVFISETNYSETYKREDVLLENIRFKVAGTSFKQEAIQKAVNYNKGESFFDERYDGLTNNEILEDTFDEPIFEYPLGVFFDCELQPEPDNEFDEEAIAVYVSSFMVGYVPKKEFEEGKKYINKLLTEDLEINQELSFLVYLSGGKYKVNREGDEVVQGKSDYKLEATFTLSTNELSDK